LIGDRPPTLLHAFTPIAKGKLSLSGADQASIASYVANERQEVLNELVGFFADTLARLPGRPSLRVDEGEAMELISRAVSEMRPDLLVMGTNGRSALVSFLIGSVTEAALRTLNVDILAVPPTNG
jgi:nucleotide-binding universal stress UspA family protein